MASKVLSHNDILHGEKYKVIKAMNVNSKLTGFLINDIIIL